VQSNGIYTDSDFKFGSIFVPLDTSILRPLQKSFGRGLSTYKKRLTS